jgi:hypothetical protein
LVLIEQQVASVPTLSTFGLMVTSGLLVGAAIINRRTLLARRENGR